MAHGAATSSPAVVAALSPQALIPGGFLVPPKLAQRIWKVEFIEGRSEETLVKILIAQRGGAERWQVPRSGWSVLTPI